MPWYDKTHLAFTQNDEQQGATGAATPRPRTPLRQAAPGACRQRRHAPERNTTDAIRQHMHTVHHLGASNTSTIYYHHYSQLGRVADGKLSNAFLTHAGVTWGPAVSTGFSYGRVVELKRAHDGPAHRQMPALPT
jgi:hypothetical protein